MTAARDGEPDGVAAPARLEEERVAPARTPQAARWTLLALTLLAIVLLALVVKPFAGALFGAAVLAGAAHPWHRALARRLGGRPQSAAALTTLAMLLLVVLPLAVMSVSVARQATEGVRYVKRTLRSEGVEGIVQDLPRPVQALARRVLAEVPADQGELQDLAQQQGGRAAAAVSGVLGATWRAIFQVAMMLVAFFFLLVDGPRLVDWMADVTPLRREQTLRLLTEFRRVAVAVLVSSVATAGIQTAVAVVGYVIAGVPNPVFFAVLTFIIGLIPAAGAAAVVLVSALLMFLSGHPGWALFLAIWGIGPVGLTDNVVKPYLIRGGVELHGAVVFFALLGGIAYFGAIGLIAGPLIVSFFLAVVRMWDRDAESPA